MATKKSSSAAKKKAAPKKQAAKKKSTTVKKPSMREESASLFSNDESAQVSLQSAAVSTSSKDKNEKNESGNGVYLFLVLAGVAAIGYLGYAKYKSKSAETLPNQTKVETPEVKVDKKPAEVTESTTAPEEAAKAEVKKFAVDKIESGKKWEEAGSYCEKLGAILPSRQEFADYSKEAASDLKTDDVYWTKNFANNTKAFAFNFKTGKSVTILKSEKHKVLCKN
ncbi:MAG: hypothetical protein SH817_02960 [Leptospira sp.]|nr:hypothetical protein [Leptospira sp.]